MTDIEPPQELSDILGKIAEKQQADSEERDRQKLYEARCLGTLTLTHNLLRRKGVVRSKSIVTGAGGNIIGMRNESMRHMITPEISAQLNGQEVSIWLEENTEAGSGYTKFIDGVNIRARIGEPQLDPHKDNVMTIVKIRRDRVTGWDGQRLDTDHLLVADKLIQFIDDSLLEQLEQPVSSSVPLTPKSLYPQGLS